MSGLPALGPRGEGWVAIQLGILAAIAGAGWYRLGAPDESWGAFAGLADLAGVAGVIGVACMAAGGALAVLSALSLRSGGALTAVPRPRAGSSLADAGPYAIVRHPIYAGIVLAGIGWALVRASGAALAADLVLLVFFDLKRRREEAWLVGHLPGYAAYMRRTRALIPGLY